MELGLTGRAANRADGRVEVIAEGRRADCEALLAVLRGGATPGTIHHVSELFGPARGGLVGFVEA